MKSVARGFGSLLFAHHLAALVGHLLFYYSLVLVQTSQDFLVCRSPRLDLYLHGHLQLVHLRKKHFLGGFLLLVDVLALQGRLDLACDLLEFPLASLCNLLGHLVEVVLQLTDGLEVLEVSLDAALIGELELLSVSVRDLGTYRCSPTRFRILPRCCRRSTSTLRCSCWRFWSSAFLRWLKLYT